ncbi:unnamed protein product [Chironomus riparius]|uniref:Uncharacterized protein n=1 Tax=Chironomus riparius TaxID=315576 RepID=A0A9N9S5Z7_9DIPT|nr:unnamed protein product [Chironomus riparius]
MEGTYEYELERAELLGVNPPERAQWEEQMKARKEAEIEQEHNEVAQVLEGEGEQAKRTQGKMDELNSILSATQVKINKFKSVCGSFTNLLRSRTSSPAPPENRQAQDQPAPNGDAPSTSINDALDNLDKMKEVNNQSDYEFAKNQTIDIASKVSKNMDALDSLIARSEQAEMSMQNQNKQMKKFLR